MVKKLLSYLLFLTVLSTAAGAQDRFMPIRVEGGDTVYVGTIKPSYVYVGKKKGKKWRKYYKLVYNFSKVYPYALYGRQLKGETDSLFKEKNMGRWKRSRYVDRIQKDLISAYEKPIRNMTLSQGQLMLRLIDRETGLPPYDIIRIYKSKVAAGFWQGVARLFGGDLKKRYDPEGVDRATEELVKKWEEDEFEGLYFSIFGKLPEYPAVLSKVK